ELLNGPGSCVDPFGVGFDSDELGDLTNLHRNGLARRLIDSQSEAGLLVAGEPGMFGLERVIAHRQSGEEEGAGSVGDHGLREPGIDVAHGDFGIEKHSPGAVDYRSSKTGGSVLSLSGHGKRQHSQQDGQGAESDREKIRFSLSL